MSLKNSKNTKAKYSAPVVMDLGELARGHGACQNGSAPAGFCTTGNGLTGPTDCSNGNRNSVGCNAGNKYGQ
jgi:hypothetical protein